MRRLKALILVGIWACGGGKPTPQPTPTFPTQPTPAPVPTASPTPTPTPTPGPAQDVSFTVDDKSEPEFFAPPWKKVAVGQTISFSTAVIDQDLDETAVTVTKMPATAKFDAVTQTVTWTPGKDEVTKKGYAPQFTIAIDQPARSKKLEKSFGIDVVNGKAIAEPAAPTQTAVIETLLLIRSNRSTRIGRSTRCSRSAPRRSSCKSPRRSARS
jgi:hypothetical protein